MIPLASDVAAALSHRYDIERPIGSGATAVVYLARDRKHGRNVAVKVLRPDIFSGGSAARFRREIAIAAGLHHPHILPLFDSGEVDGFTYFTMPYVDGESLRKALERQGLLPLRDVLQISRQVASALSYAHARGILHRDVKPENILMQEGVPQLADFGVACALYSDPDSRLTKTGTAVGTALYMSPEHWNDAHRVDDRSDIYSFGCMLYEMITGAPPFIGANANVVMARHAFDPVPPIHSARANTPARLEKAVERALAKVPGDRFDSMAEFAAELAEIDLEVRTNCAAPAPSTRVRRAPRDRPSILVLPFATLGNGDSDYVAPGLTDEIITSLSGLEGVRVIAHTSALQLGRSGKSALGLAEELNVSYVLEGSVRSAGDLLRISVRLTAAEPGELVWGASYEGQRSALFQLEKELSASVIAALSVRLSSHERKRLAEHRISDGRAFEYYVRARQEIYRFTGEALHRALDYLRQGLELCGENITILAAMGQVYWQFINAGISTDPGYFERARECAQRILELDPESPEAHRLLGLLEINAKGDCQVAVDYLKFALDANPNDPESLFWLSIIYGFVGRPSTGYALAIRLLDIDPLTPLHHLVPGFLDVLDGDPERGLPWLARAHEMEPANPIIGIALGQALAMAGRDQEACQVLEGLDDAVPGSFFATFGRFCIHALRLQRIAALDLLTPDLLESVRTDLQYSWMLSQCLARLGESQAACEWLENAIEHGFWNYPLLMERDEMLSSVRGMARFGVLMQRVKSKWLGFRA